jgi:mono/diheme cytochrome c family protein
MQTKVVIGTISFMLVMIILGLAALLEPAELERITDARAGRQIESGAVLFKENCAECHGVDGKAQLCIDYSGEEKGCAGLPLNHLPFLCGEPSERMTQLGWSGSKNDLIFQTISAGRPGTLMPTWSEQFGGPMEAHQIEQLTAYILNWSEDPALCGDEAVVEVVEWPESVEDLPEGDVGSGEELYQINGCFACHGQVDNPDSAVVGPHQGNIANDAATRIPGMSAAQYIYESILDPNAFIALECPNGPCNDPSQMRLDYAGVLDEQAMADLVAFFMTLTGE